MEIFIPVLLALLAARTLEVVTLASINYFRELQEYKRILREESQRARPSITEDRDEQ